MCVQPPKTDPLGNGRPTSNGCPSGRLFSGVGASAAPEDRRPPDYRVITGGRRPPAVLAFFILCGDSHSTRCVLRAKWSSAACRGYLDVERAGDAGTNRFRTDEQSTCQRGVISTARDPSCPPLPKGGRLYKATPAAYAKEIRQEPQKLQQWRGFRPNPGEFRRRKIEN